MAVARLQPEEQSTAVDCEDPRGRVVCVSDLHGNIGELESLWKNLTKELGEDGLAAATVVFLGDFCDRGPRTSDVLTFLADLYDSREPGRTVLLAGNHDLGMAAFLGCLPVDREHPDLDATRKPEFTYGFWPHPVAGGMHYQGRRWAGSPIFQAKSTFKSYGVAWDPHDPELREKLLQAVPERHKALLRSLRWVHDQAVPWKPGRVVCVHAGLLSGVPAEEQVAALTARDLALPVLHENGDPGRIAAFSGRDNVWEMHPELAGRAVLVSGHHGHFAVQGDRIISDRSGGVPGRPLEAVVLPSRRVITSR